MRKNTITTTTTAATAAIRTEAIRLRSTGALAIVRKVEAIASASADFTAAVAAGKFQEADRLSALLGRQTEVPGLLRRAKRLLEACRAADAATERRQQEEVLSNLLGRRVRFAA